VVIVAETSAALGTTERGEARRALLAILHALPASERVTILAADWNTSAIVEAAPPAEAERALGRLDAVVGAGALHLERALTEALARAQRDHGAVLFVGRGVDPFPGDALRAPLLAARDDELRLSVVTVGRPPEPLADAAAITGGVAVESGTLAWAMSELLAALKPWPPRPSLEARGLDGWRPLEASDGGTVWLGRALEGPHLAANEPPAATAEPADLLALWDRARLSWAERGMEGQAGAGDRVALAPLRALLVLENDAEYARYGLTAPAPVADESKTEIAPRLTVRLKGELYGLRSRGDDRAVGNDAADVPNGLVGEETRNASILGALVGNQIAEAYGVGALGLVGTGAGGGGTGEGTVGLGNLGTITKGGSGYGRGAGGLAGRRAVAPDVIPGQASVRGSLDKEIIRRIVRRHVNELRYCYEQDTPPHAEPGRIVDDFTISPSGQVVSAQQRSASSLIDLSVGRCFLDAIRRWQFPKSTGGEAVTVSFPFTLVPAAGGAPAKAPTPTPASAQGSPATTPAPASEEALAILAGPEALETRVRHLCERLGLDRTGDPETAAWSIDRRDIDLSTVVLVARLLAAAGHPADAVRVLSERAPLAPAAVVEELRRQDAAHDADEVEVLQRRAR
jgi:hypothetical protein